MRFFSKFVFISNLCFIVMVVMQLLQHHDKVKGKIGVAAPLQFVEGTVVVLGMVSLLVNAVFCIIAVGLLATKKIKKIPRWIVIFNFISLLAEIYWFLIDNNI